jgi:hypothetical protein
MVVAISILGVVTAALAALIIVVLAGNDSTGTIATDSRDEQLLATYFQRDIESATSVTTVVASMQCRDGPIDRQGTNPIMEVSYPTTNATASVDYYYVPGGGAVGAPSRLYRRACLTSVQGGSTLLISDDVLVRNLRVTGGTPAVQPSDAASCATCWTISLAAGHPYAVTGQTRVPSSTIPTLQSSTTTTGPGGA